jgi:transcription elongation factor Elf1
MIDKDETMICPRCGKEFLKYLAALCRVDNKTLICSECGTQEAMEDYFGEFPPKVTPYWREDDC